MIGKCNTGGENLTTQLDNQDAIITEIEAKVQSVSSIDMVGPVNAQTLTIEQIQESLVGKAQGANATADKILQGYSAYVGQELINGTFTPSEDSDLVPENIREGIDIWGVVGTLVEGATVKKGTVTFSNTVNNPVLTTNIAHGLGVKPTVFGLNEVVIKYNGDRSSVTHTLNVTANATNLVVKLSDNNNKSDFDTSMTSLSWYAGV